MGVFLSYASPQGHAPLDQRIFLPKAWAGDQERREAGVPEEVAFATKPQLARDMLQHARELDVPAGWVTGDELYGDSPDFRAGVEACGHAYVLAALTTTPVWTRRPRVAPPPPQPMTRPRKKARLAEDAPTGKTVTQVVERWPTSRWMSLSVGEGEKVHASMSGRGDR